MAPVHVVDSSAARSLAFGQERLAVLTGALMTTITMAPSMVAMERVWEVSLYQVHVRVQSVAYLHHSHLQDGTDDSIPQPDPEAGSGAKGV